MFPISGHPVMRSDASFIEILAGLVFRDSITPLLEHAAMRVVNHATDEKKKKVKHNKKARWQAKEWAKLDQGKR